jgi:hypothetical protein
MATRLKLLLKSKISLKNFTKSNKGVNLKMGKQKSPPYLEN